MKTPRFTQLFLYCSGGEHSVKCVRPALEMETRKKSREVAEGVAMRPRVLPDGITILHDNARPHTANLMRDKLQRFG